MVKTETPSEAQTAKQRILFVDDQRTFRESPDEVPGLSVCVEAEGAQQASAQSGTPQMVLQVIRRIVFPVRI